MWLLWGSTVLLIDPILSQKHLFRDAIFRNRFVACNRDTAVVYCRGLVLLVLYHFAVNAFEKLTSI